MLLWQVSAPLKTFIAKHISHSTSLPGVSFLGNHISSLICKRLIPSLTPDACFSKKNLLLFIIEQHGCIPVYDAFGYVRKGFVCVVLYPFTLL